MNLYVDDFEIDMDKKFPWQKQKFKNLRVGIFL